MRLLPLALLAVAACAPKGPTPADVCAKLVSAGVAKNCRTGNPAGLGALASSSAEFDLPSVPGKTGQILGFKEARDFRETSEKFRAAALLAGPHRYGNEKALIFVQMNDKTPADVGAKAKAVVDAL